jgi:hypothetical protein
MSGKFSCNSKYGKTIVSLDEDRIKKSSSGGSGGFRAKINRLTFIG